MAAREILVYPQEKATLRARSIPVQNFNQALKRLIADLKDTLLLHQEGIGLAAPQIGVPKRVVVVRLNGQSDCDQTADPPIALVNPQILEARQERKDFDGCLSFPGLFGETIRPHFLRVSGLDEEGRPFDRTFTEFDAVLVHHEIDHLDGTLFIDRIESLDDLYRIFVDPGGKNVRMPMSKILSSE